MKRSFRCILWFTSISTGGYSLEDEAVLDVKYTLGVRQTRVGRWISTGCVEEMMPIPLNCSCMDGYIYGVEWECYFEEFYFPVFVVKAYNVYRREHYYDHSDNDDGFELDVLNIPLLQGLFKTDEDCRRSLEAHDRRMGYKRQRR